MSSVLAALTASSTVVPSEEQPLPSPPQLLTQGQLREKLKAQQDRAREERRLAQLGMSPEQQTAAAVPPSPSAQQQQQQFATSSPAPVVATSGAPALPRAFAGSQQGPSPVEVAAYHKGIADMRANMTTELTMAQGGGLLYGVAGTLGAIVVLYGLYSVGKWMLKPAATTAAKTVA